MQRGQSTAGRKRLDEVDQATQGDRNPERNQHHNQPPARGAEGEEQEPHRDRFDDAVEENGRTGLDIGRPEGREAGEQQQRHGRARSDLQSVEAPQPADRRPAGIVFVRASRLGGDTGFVSLRPGRAQKPAGCQGQHEDGLEEHLNRTHLPGDLRSIPARRQKQDGDEGRPGPLNRPGGRHGRDGRHDGREDNRELARADVVRGMLVLGAHDQGREECEARDCEAQPRPPTCGSSDTRQGECHGPPPRTGFVQ